MHDDDKALREMLQRWKPASPPPDLAARVTGRATALAQVVPLPRRVLEALEHALTEWRYALGYKAAFLAICGVAGIVVGQLPLTSAEADVVALALAEDIWVGVL